MTFLQPLLLLAAAAVAVPLLLHLYHRRGRRVVFPAIRYLVRAEREHSREIRFRQLLLLLLRVAAVLLLTLAAARLFVPGRGGDHRPTALAVVLDNSASSARVVGERRVLDLLKQRARDALALAGPEDRIWVVRAGEPWEVAAPGGREAALARVDSTAPTDAGGDLAEALRRARALVESAELPAAEIHLLSDLQASAFPGDDAPAGDVPVVVYPAPSASESTEAAGPTPNRFIGAVEIGGGLPPLSGQRTEVSVHVGGGAVEEGDGLRPPVPVRVVVDERIRAAGAARPGDAVVLPFGPFAGGTVAGWAETDPDDLGVDDRRWFVFDVRPPVPVHRSGGPAPFLDEALAVLEDEGRTVRTDPSGAAVHVVAGGGGPTPGSDLPVVVVPPSDPALLPGLNRRLAESGVPWRFEAPAGEGDAVVAEVAAPVELEGVRVARHYRLVPAGPEPGVAAADASVPARLAGGEPFLVEGRGGGRAWILLAVPLDPSWTDLPVSAAMVPLLQWALTRHGGRGVPARTTGEPISTPPGATAVRDPGGTEHPVDGARSFRRTGRAGIWQILAGDSVVERVALNVPVRESLLAPLPPDRLADAVGAAATVVDGAGAWRDAVFASRRGREPWRPLLLAALLVLLAESWLAASGARGRSGSPSGNSAGSAGRRRQRVDGTPRSARGASSGGTGRPGTEGADTGLSTPTR